MPLFLGSADQIMHDPNGCPRKIRLIIKIDQSLDTIKFFAIFMLILLILVSIPFIVSIGDVVLRISSENPLFKEPFNCLPYPADPTEVKEPFYSLCLKFSPSSNGFFSPTYIPVVSKNDTDTDTLANTSTFHFDTMFPSLNFTLSFIIPNTVRGLAIAGLFALTDNKTGKALEPGIQLAEAMRCAIANINANQNLLPTTQLNYQIWDTHGLASYAINAAYLAMQLNISAFIGLYSYEEVFSVAPLVTPSSLTITSGLASSSFLNNQLLFPTFYRTVPGDKFVAITFLRLFEKFEWNQFAVVYGNDFVGASGLDSIEFARSTSSQYGYNPYLLCQASLSPTELASFAEDVFGFINCIRITKVRAIILWTNVDDAISIISQIIQAGSDVYTKDTMFFAPFSWSGAESSIENLNALSHGIITEAIMHGSFLLQPRAFSQTTVRRCIAQQTPKNNHNTAFLRYWQSFFKCTLKNSSLFDADSYVSEKLSNNATIFFNLRSRNMASSKLLEKVFVYSNDENFNETLPICPGEPVEERDPINALCICPETDFLDNNFELSPYVNYIYDATYALAYAFDQLLTTCGDFTPCDLPYFTNSDLLAALNETNFEGLTGRVSWLGHDRNMSDISLFQYCYTGSTHHTGNSNFSGVYIYLNNLCFKTPYIPMSVIIPEVANFSSTVGIIMGSLFLAVIVICILLMIFLWNKKDTEPVYTSGLLFLEMFLFGAILICFSSLLWTLNMTTFLCFAKLIVLALGFSLLFGCMAAKLFRVFEVCCSLREPEIGVDAFALFVFSGCIFLLNALLLLVLLLAGGQLNPTLERANTSSLYFYLACRCTGGYDIQETISLIQLAINLILILAALGVSISTLSIYSPHGENASIAVALVDLFIVSLTLVIIYFNTDVLTGTIQSQYIIRSVGTLYLVIFTICLILVPKLLAIFRGRPQGDSGEWGGQTPLVHPDEVLEEAGANFDNFRFSSSSMASPSVTTPFTLRHREVSPHFHSVQPTSTS